MMKMVTKEVPGFGYGKPDSSLLDKLNRTVIVEHPDMKFKGTLCDPESNMNVANEFKAGMPKGTHFYRKNREVLDRLTEMDRRGNPDLRLTFQNLNALDKVMPQTVNAEPMPQGADTIIGLPSCDEAQSQVKPFELQSVYDQSVMDTTATVTPMKPQ